MTAYLKYKNSDKGLLFWLCVASAILFNPIIPIHLTRQLWMFFNIAMTILFGYMAYIIRKE